MISASVIVLSVIASGFIVLGIKRSRPKVVRTIKCPKEDSVTKQEFVSAQVSVILAAIVQPIQDALVNLGGACYDQGALDQKGIDGSFSQADIDKAVQAAKDSDASVLQAAQADAQSKLSALQSQLDSAVAAKSADDQILQGFQSHAAQLQAALDALKAIIFPAPPVVPAPVDPGQAPS